MYKEKHLSEKEKKDRKKERKREQEKYIFNEKHIFIFNNIMLWYINLFFNGLFILQMT